MSFLKMAEIDLTECKSTSGQKKKKNENSLNYAA